MLKYIRSQTQIFVIILLVLGSTFAWVFWGEKPEVSPEFLARNPSYMGTYMGLTVIYSTFFGLLGALSMTSMTRLIVYGSAVAGFEHIVHSKAKRYYSVAIGLAAPIGGLIIALIVKYRIDSWSWAWFLGGTLFFAGLLLLDYSKAIKNIESAKET